VTFHIWDDMSREFDQEVLQSFYDIAPPIPQVGEVVHINISGPGELVEYLPYTVMRREFEYTAGRVLLPNVPKAVMTEVVGVDLYVRAYVPRTARIPGEEQSIPPLGSGAPR
jgi:hypothetical protein